MSDVNDTTCKNCLYFLQITYLYVCITPHPTPQTPWPSQNPEICNIPSSELGQKASISPTTASPQPNVKGFGVQLLDGDPTTLPLDNDTSGHMAQTIEILETSIRIRDSQIHSHGRKELLEKYEPRSGKSRDMNGRENRVRRHGEKVLDFIRLKLATFDVTMREEHSHKVLCCLMVNLEKRTGEEIKQRDRRLSL